MYKLLDKRWSRWWVRMYEEFVPITKAAPSLSWRTSSLWVSQQRMKKELVSFTEKFCSGELRRRFGCGMNTAQSLSGLPAAMWKKYRKTKCTLLWFFIVMSRLYVNALSNMPILTILIAYTFSFIFLTFRKYISLIYFLYFHFFYGHFFPFSSSLVSYIFSP